MAVDGTKLYIIGQGGQEVNEYGLSTPFDISSATFNQIALDVSGEETAPVSMLFNDDGTKFYVMGQTGDDINEYDLSTAYDISSATFNQIALDVSGEVTFPTAMLFNDDGTKLYVMGETDDEINEYDLSTAYDISSATFNQIALDVSGQEASPHSIVFNDDGTKLYLTGNNGDDVNEYDLSTPYDISSATFNQIALDVSGEGGNPLDLLFNDDGTVIYVAESGEDEINEYTLSTPYDVSSGSFNQIALDVSGEEATVTDVLFGGEEVSEASFTPRVTSVF